MLRCNSGVLSGLRVGEGMGWILLVCVVGFKESLYVEILLLIEITFRVVFFVFGGGWAMLFIMVVHVQGLNFSFV